MAKADHAVSLNMTAALTVGSRTVELPIRRNGRRIGVLTINDQGVQWNPSTVRPPVSISWEDLPTALTSATSLSTTPASTPRPSTKRSAAPSSRKRMATTSTSTATTPAETAPADETGNREAGSNEATPERSRPAGKSAARRKTAAAARQASGRTEATTNEVSSLAEVSTTAASTGETPSLEALLEGAVPLGTSATADTTDLADTVAGTVGDADDEQVQGQQSLPLGGLDTLDAIGVGPGAQISAEAGDTLSTTSTSGAESEATTAAQPTGRRAAARKSAKKAPPRQAGEPAAREVTSAPARANNATVPGAGAGAGADTTPLDVRAVRQWAAANGITVPPRGPLSTRVREQYLAAH